MSDPVMQSFIFLISTIFDLFLLILSIRLLLVWGRVNYFNPLVQFITKFTDFIVKPIRRIVPNIGRLETASLLLIVVLCAIKYSFILIISAGYFNPLGLIILTSGNVLKLIIDIFFYAILLQAILSWIQPYSPISYTLNQLTAPMLQPIQRVMPPISGIDISPLFALILLQFLSILLVNSLFQFGYRVAIS